MGSGNNYRLETPGTKRRAGSESNRSTPEWNERRATSMTREITSRIALKSHSAMPVGWRSLFVAFCLGRVLRRYWGLGCGCRIRWLSRPNAPWMRGHTARISDSKFPIMPIFSTFPPIQILNAFSSSSKPALCFMPCIIVEKNLS